MNINFKHQALLALCTVFLISCKDQREIKRTVENVYELKPELCQTENLSDELQDLLENVKRKPQTIKVKEPQEMYDVEGSLLSGTQKRFTSFTINSIGIRYNKAVAVVSLVDAASRIEWIDTVKLVYQKRWKVDDIIYDKVSHPTVPTLKENLQKSKREVYS